jgi:hypothetical protein
MNTTNIKELEKQVYAAKEACFVDGKIVPAKVKEFNALAKQLQMLKGKV